MAFLNAGLYQDPILDDRGNALPQASVQVNLVGGGAATLYTSRTKAVAAANPVTTAGVGSTIDANGNLSIFADPGPYDLVITVDGVVTTVRITVPIDPDEAAQDTDVSLHLSDASDAHDASAISFVPAGTIAASNVQAAIEEVASEAGGDVAAHLADGTDAHDASAVSFVPAGTVAATDVQSAIAEVSGDVTTVASDLASHLGDPTAAHAASAVSFIAGGSLASTDVQSALAEVATDYIAADAVIAGNLAAHLADTVDAHDASAISFLAVGTIGSTDVQAAIAEVSGDVTVVVGDLAAHLADATAAHAASAVSFSPVGTIAATDVQAAIAEVSADVAAIGVGPFTAGSVVYTDGTGQLTTEAAFTYTAASDTLGVKGFVNVGDVAVNSQSMVNVSDLGSPEVRLTRNAGGQHAHWFKPNTYRSMHTHNIGYSTATGLFSLDNVGQDGWATQLADNVNATSGFRVLYMAAGAAATATPTLYLWVDRTGLATFTAGTTQGGALLFSSDNVYDIGAAGATRPRTVYAGTAVVAPAFYSVQVPTAASDVFAASVTGDTQSRFVLNADGSHEWGSGAAVADIFLARQSAGRLTAYGADGVQNILFVESHGAAASGAAFVNLYSRGTRAVPTVAQIGDSLGSWQAQSWTTGSTYSLGAAVGSYATQVHGAGASGADLRLGATANSGAFAWYWSVANNGHLLAFADATYNIGANGANRPLDIFASSSIVVPLHSSPASATATSHFLRSAVTGDAQYRSITTADGFTTLGTGAAVGDLRLGRFATGSYFQVDSPNGVGGILWRVSNGTLAAPTTVTNTNVVGNFVSQAHDGTQYLSNAAIQFYMTGTVGTNRVPSRIVFLTSTDAAPSVLRGIWEMQAAGHLVASADNVYDLGAAGAARPRTAYLGTSLFVGATKVVGAQGAAVADAASAIDVILRFNELLARVRATTGHGLIAG